MPLTYQYDRNKNIVHVKAMNPMSQNDIMEHVKRIIADKEIQRDYIVVSDYSEVNKIKLKYEETKPFQYIWDQYLKKGCRIVFIYAPGDLTYGIFRMLQSKLALNNKEADARFKVVKERAEIDRYLEEMEK